MALAATIGADLSALAAAAPLRPALTCDGETLTRARLAHRVAHLSREITARTGTGAGVALDMANGVDLVALFFACAVSGRQALVYDPAWPARYRAAIDGALAPALTVTGTEPWLGEGEDAVFPVPPAPDAPFYVGFTSGSTGLPKGYRRAHRSWIDSFTVSEVEFGLSADDVIMAPGGLAASLHLYGVVHALHIGARAVMMRQFHPRRALGLIARHGVTALYVTPTQLQMLIEAAGHECFPSLRQVMISGAKWQARTREATMRLFPQAGICEFYGASELSFVTVSRAGEPVPPGSVGRAAHGVELRIRDGEGCDLPAGEVGAIWGGSTLLFDGYACGGGDEIRREDGFMTVGDHGRLDADGFLFLHGREKRMLVTSGLNVYPEEVEAVLATLPGVVEACVFGLPDPLRGVELVAVLRGTVDERALRAGCRALLPAAKVPRRFLHIEDWPRTSGGKADLTALARLAEQAAGPH
ncbi:AMP-binding protein [Ancylobacter sp. A5.8]|uniref:AMP-binding protein n=1 Tax=Ancylobacter gelatini TaxID=2919920 RepID=UPI001F4EAF5E|nr:AMP-binding protein [Ancylobacter gelatini]MCJ8143654.1 AMP-binding protein [Ancylobacter gelatini]